MASQGLLDPSDSFFVAGPAHSPQFIVSFFMVSTSVLLPIGFSLRGLCPLPQPRTTLGANLYLYLALPSTHHGWRFLNPPGARFTCPPQVFPWNLGLADLALHTWKQIIYFGAFHLSCDLFRPSLHIPGWEPADALWLPNTLHKYLLKKVGERAAAAASESRTLIELRGVVDLEEVAKILVTQRLRL